MGFIDAFVSAHHQHRRSIENSGNFGDCMKGRIRFMTAITPAYAHAYQATPRRDSQGPRLLPMITTFLAVTTTTVTGMPFHLLIYTVTIVTSFQLLFFTAPEGAASVLSRSGVALRSSGVDSCLRKDHVPGKDASVKCFEAVLGKVRLPCLRFVAARNVPGRWITVFVASLLILRVSRWFHQARKPLPTAYGRMAKSARRCSLWPSPRHRCFLPPHVAGDCTVFLFLFFCPLLCPRLPSRWSSRCFPSSWPDTVFPLLSFVATGIP